MYLIVICITLIVMIICLKYKYNKKKRESEQIGGRRKAIFSRWSYQPDLNYISADYNTSDKLYKQYNLAGRLKLIDGRPYKYYTMLDGNYGYPWHFPQATNNRCFKLSQMKCQEPIDINLSKFKTVIPSKCIDSVFKQCLRGIDPLYIKVKNKGIY